MKKMIILGVALAALIAGPLLARGNREDEAPEQADPAVTGAEQATEDLIARVNGRGITRQELDDLVESNVSRYEMQSNQSFPAEQLPQLQSQIMEGLIMRTVLEMETERLGITVSDERFAETLGQFRMQFPDGDSYRNALRQQGFTEERFEEELRRQILIEDLITREALDGLALSESELREFYQQNPEYFERPEQVSARHIIISTQGVSGDGERAARREQIEDIRRRIVDGEDFGDMARQYSEDGSASDGGRLGTFGRGQMVPEFEDAAFSLEVGELSSVVETQFGYHLVQVTERTPGRTIPFEDVRGDIEEFLLDDARNEAAQEYVQGLRAAARVEELAAFD